MPDINQDLHGNVPDKSSVALLLIDVINDLEFTEGRQLLESALPMAKRIAELKTRAKRAGVPAIYVNDNFGKWQSDFSKILEHCLQDDVCGKPIAEILKPDQEDYFVLKPKHSGFFSTTLDILLEYLEAKTLILTGIAGNICVLFTANDAYMRDFRIYVPTDCTASNTAEDNERVLKADTTPSTELDFDRIKEEAETVSEEASKPEPQTPQFARKEGGRS